LNRFINKACAGLRLVPPARFLPTVVQDRLRVNLTVLDALPNTTYVLDVRCWTFGPQNELGTLTTNSQGTGTAQIKLNGATPLNPFYIDISVKGGAGGVGGYGDTFIAGPFNLG
jgi:hypothetical protein